MLDFRTPGGISDTAGSIAAVNSAAVLILNRSTVPDEMERINIVSLLLRLSHDLAAALDEANAPDLDNGEGGS